MRPNEKIIAYINRDRQMYSVLEYIEVIIDDKELEIAILNGFTSH